MNFQALAFHHNPVSLRLTSSSLPITVIPWQPRNLVSLHLTSTPLALHHRNPPSPYAEPPRPLPSAIDPAAALKQHTGRKQVIFHPGLTKVLLSSTWVTRQTRRTGLRMERQARIERWRETVIDTDRYRQT